MTASTVFHRFQDRQKDKTIKMLQELIKKIERGNVVVKNSGFWNNNMGDEISFKIDVKNVDISKSS